MSPVEWFCIALALAVVLVLMFQGMTGCAVVTLAVLLAALVVSGCGGGGEDDATRELPKKFIVHTATLGVRG